MSAGQGGVGSGGTLNIRGGCSFSGPPSGQGGRYSMGGGTIWGSGGIVGATNPYGSGGGGTPQGYSGGDGTQGIVVIEY